MDGMEDIGILKVAPHVYDALKHGSAVVALESTIISHGMPYPQNLQTAKEVEAIVKENGAIPATIAILDGVPCIGLDDEQLERLAKLGSTARKTARRDIPHVIAAGENGATTVSATMFFAYKVGIYVFVTGGIGGVHRHSEQTMDISSDLTELGRTPVAIISAGVKSILDIPKTLEYLETQGVTVAAYRTNEFPAFFTESSGCQTMCRLDSPEECARLINANLNIRLGSGMLIAVPIPKELAADGDIIENAIQRALKEAMQVKNYFPAWLYGLFFLLSFSAFVGVSPVSMARYPPVEHLLVLSASLCLELLLAEPLLQIYHESAAESLGVFMGQFRSIMPGIENRPL